MDRNLIQDRLDAYVAEGCDSGLIEPHLATCADCRRAVAELTVLRSAMAEAPQPLVPEALWHAIERRLDQAPAVGVRRGRRLRPLALAASVGLAISATMFALHRWGDGASKVVAAPSVDFDALLAHVARDGDRGLDQFLREHRARPVTPEEARTVAPDVRFSVPEALPGGFARQAVYALPFGQRHAVAARYQRGDELVCAIFHPAMSQAPGPDGQKRCTCTVGQHGGCMESRGQWNLLRVTEATGCRCTPEACQCDPTTCHCVVSRLNEPAELPAIVAAISRDEDAKVRRTE